MRRLLFLLSLVFVFTGGISSALAESIKAGHFPAVLTRGDAISEFEYWDLVQQSGQVISSLQGSSNTETIPELTALASQWKTTDKIRLEDGQTIQVDNSYLLSLLNASQPDIERISGLFDALLAAHKNYPSKIYTAQDLEPLHEILSGSEFQWKVKGPNPVSEFLDRIFRQFLEWLNKILGGRGITIGGSPSLLYTVAVIALCIVLFFVFRTLFVDFINEARLAEENIAEELLTSESAFQKAQELSRGGDYRSAVRFLYLSSLLLLDERGLLRYDRSKTNREYLRSLSDSPDLEKPLSEVIEVFDEVWYGYHSLDEDTFKHYSDRVEELKERKQ